MRSFDDRFAEHVRQVFDAYHEEVDEMALADFKDRMAAAKTGHRLYLWGWAAAAALLLASATFMMDWSADVPDALPEVAALSPAPSEDLRPTEIPDAEEEAVAQPEAEIRSLAKTPSRVAKDSEVQAAAAQADAKHMALTEETLVAVAETPPESVALAVIPPPATSNETRADVPQGNEAVSLVIRPQETAPTAITELEPRQSDKRRTSFDFTAGSNLTVAQGQLTDGAGFVAGVLAEYDLGRGFSLTSGTVLSYNTFEYDPRGTGPQPSELELLADRARADGSVDLSVDMSSRVQWLGVDIPLNVKWRPPSFGGKLHLAAGLSSMLLLREETKVEGQRYRGAVHVTSSNNVAADVERTPYAQTYQESTLSHNDLGSLLNMQVGQTFAIADLPVTLELYVKYPLGSLTSREIAVGMGGLSVNIPLGGR